MLFDHIINNIFNNIFKMSDVWIIQNKGLFFCLNNAFKSYFSSTGSHVFCTHCRLTLQDSAKFLYTS